MEPYLGEIQLFAMGMIPRGWHLCDGTILQIPYYAALFAVIGKTYGGNGTTTFALPDLRGRVAVCPNYMNRPDVIPVQNEGIQAGNETVVLEAANVPSHTHLVATNTAAGTAKGPTNGFLAAGAAGQNLYGAAGTSQVNLNINSLSTSGGSQGHANMQPFLVMNYCIAMQGYFPPRS
ncbi:MAG: tail fiber protein [Pelosinus sp.]|nr:tail fiber protein [Pelosinus sp.]